MINNHIMFKLIYAQIIFMGLEMSQLFIGLIRTDHGDLIGIQKNKR